MSDQRDNTMKEDQLSMPHHVCIGDENTGIIPLKDDILQAGLMSSSLPTIMTDQIFGPKQLGRSRTLHLVLLSRKLSRSRLLFHRSNDCHLPYTTVVKQAIRAFGKYSNGWSSCPRSYH